MSSLIASGLPFVYFMLVASLTPGPNNVMLTASGINFGYKRTLPHILGVVVGCALLLLLVVLGVGAAYHAYPPLQLILKVLGSCYLVYLAYRILTASGVGLKEEREHASRPIRFIEAFGFQFINPKAIVFFITAVNILPDERSLFERCLIAVIGSSLVCMLSTHTWTFFGKLLAKLFRNDRTRLIVNVLLALLLLATIPMMVR
ncbi:MAG: putative amino acid efflux protein [Puniceicoccaceae bacterium 5H]|nr:MAG: putative amino acid efflux protein [Puniceicoccaceae bacterium 5H]